jgi:hypothetical protein
MEVAQFVWQSSAAVLLAVNQGVLLVCAGFRLLVHTFDISILSVKSFGWSMRLQLGCVVHRYLAQALHALTPELQSCLLGSLNHLQVNDSPSYFTLPISIDLSLIFLL